MRRWWRICRWALLSLGAVLAIVTGLLAWMLLSESGARRLLMLAETLAAGVGVELRVDQVSGTVTEGLQLRGLYLSTGPLLSLELQRMDFAWRPWHLAWRQLPLDRVVVEGLVLRNRSDDAAPPDEPFDARVISDWFALLPVSLELGGLHARALRFELDGSDIEVPNLDLSARLDSGGFELRSLALAVLQAELHVSALRLQPDLSLQATVDWVWTRDAERYAGTAQLAGSLLDLALQHTLQTPAVLSSSGSVITGLGPGQALQLDLRHQLQRLDLGPWGQPDAVLSELELLTRGSPEALDLRLDVQLEYQDFAPLALQAQARYTPEAIELSRVAVDSAELALQATARWDFAREALALDWTLVQLALEREGLQLRDVAGSGSVALQLVDDGVDAQLQLGPLQGLLNEQPLVLDGQLQLVASQPTALSLGLGSGANRLTVQGDLQPELALDWELQAPALTQLHGGLDGSIAGSGELQGSLEAPLLIGTLQGAALSFAQDARRLRLARLQLDARAAQNGDNALSLQLGELQLEEAGEPRQLLQQARVDLGGSPAAHQLQVQATGMELALQLDVSGALEEGDWRGRVAAARIGTPAGDWVLQQSFDLSWVAAQLALERHCWNAAPMALCLAANGGPGGQSGRVELSGLPLAWLNRAAAAPDKPLRLQELQTAWGLDLPPGLTLQGELSLNADIGGWRSGLPDTVQADLLMQDLVVAAAREIEPGDGEDPVIETGRFGIDAGPLRLSRQAGLWRARAELAVNQQSDAGDTAAAFQGRLGADLSLDDDGFLGGTVQLGFDDLGFLQSLVPAVDRPVGRLQGVAQLSGTLQTPRIEADVRVSEAAFGLPALGIELHGIGATLRSDNDRVQLDVSALSGDGALGLQAELLRPLDASRALSARLQGSDFRVLAREDLQATISPELELRFADAALSLQGRVTVPSALLDLASVVADVGEGGVAVSHDAVVVQPDSEALLAEQQRVLPFDAQLDLVLGDDVQLRGFGLEAALRGELRVEQEAGRPLLAYGELNMPQATYRIYNQELNARDGRLLFYGNPANPTLDIRAFRETPTAEVGMLLSGTVGRIQSRLYSTPTLPENEILAILITGKSFNDMNDQDGNALLNAVANFGIERGEGLTSMIGNKLGLDSVAINGGASYLDSSLGLGKYITPDLLLRYEIGLFDRQAVLSIDYSLTERLRLEVRSGLSQSVDISYTIEKD